MLITLFCLSAICQSVVEVQLTGVVPLGAVSQRFNLILKRCGAGSISEGREIFCQCWGLFPTQGHEEFGDITDLKSKK